MQCVISTWALSRYDAFYLTIFHVCYSVLFLPGLYESMVHSTWSSLVYALLFLHGLFPGMVQWCILLLSFFQMLAHPLILFVLDGTEDVSVWQ